jgi:hypothetical protein
MKAIYLLALPSVLLGQEVRAPQRGEERREPNRVERPEPVRVQPPIQEERQRPVEPQHPPQPPVMGGRPPIVYVDPFFYPRPYDCWNRWDCRNRISVELEMSRRNRRPTRLEMAPIRQPLTDKQKKQLLALRKEFIRKRDQILNNP